MNEFAERLLGWWQDHGRHDLPWQLERTPYRVWVSEIMLQQTQVATVITYFQRFMLRFPNMSELADAQLDEVLALWSGLGYYARARNLHRSARLCCQRHGGELPDDAAALEALPGVGRSTAHAILAQAWNRRAPILDGNVKRVLARHAGIEGWPGHGPVLKKLWREAETRTPLDRAADYTQAVMDLGAGLCTSRKPACLLCPVSEDCRARIENRISELPQSRPRRERPHRETTLLVVRDAHDRVLLRRRPPRGIWGGLWCLPETGEATTWGVSFEFEDEAATPLSPIEHQFTHFSLTIHFRFATDLSDKNDLNDADLKWIGLNQALDLGLPRPIRTALERLGDL